MSLEFEEIQDEPRRPIWVGILGAMLVIAAGYVYYGVLQQRPVEQKVPYDYQYTIKQSIDTNVTYFDNSFFDSTKPDITNTAYVTSLTDTVGAVFHYDYTASEAKDIEYSYDIKATVRGSYLYRADKKDLPKVWSNEHVLVYPKTTRNLTKEFSLDPSIEIPFADYKKEIDQVNTSLGLSLDGEAVIAMTVRVSGDIGGTKFSDVKVSTVTVPLDQQIFTVASKYSKKDTKQVASKATKSSWNIADHYEEILAVVLAAIGLLLLVYGFRKQIFKSAYQRELDRIYRLHDGIIVRASKAADLTGKNVVSVKTFDDMLNLEEELKVPIVASPAGNDGTRFIIMRDDVAYVYALGNVLIEDETVNEVDANDLEEAKKPMPKKRPLNQASRRKIQ